MASKLYEDAPSALAGLLFSTYVFAWPLVIGGSLKIAYDLLLLWRFQKVRPPEEI